MVEVGDLIKGQDLAEQIAANPSGFVSQVRSGWIDYGDLRLDAGYYSTGAAHALLALDRHAGGTQQLGKLVSKCFLLGRFKRIYAGSSEMGWPYLSPSETFHFRPASTRWIARENAPKDSDDHFAKAGWILLSASGTVGRPMLATQRVERFFLSHDLIRIVPSTDIPAGYLYTYLSSWIGQALLTRNRYGAVIKHLEPHHVTDIPVPLLSVSEMQEIANLIERAYVLREKANQLLDTATTELYGELALPPFEESLIEYLPQNESNFVMGSLRAFTVTSSTLRSRLDASFHIPLAKTAVRIMLTGRYHPVPLEEACEDIFHPGRFKRIYVTKEYGVPFIQGSHVPLMKPYDLQYLARSDERHLQQCRVSRHWMLITRSGTVGQVGIVSSITNGWAASEHLIRLVAEEGAYNPGYISLFLMTPYGQHQVQSKIYGAVVDELTPEDLSEVLIPDAPKKVQDAIGSKVLEAFEMKDRANLFEQAAVERLEGGLREDTVDALVT